MKITESRANDILHWLDDMAGDHVLLFDEMTRYRDAAALIRQLRDAEQAAWHAGLDAGREQGRGKDHTHQPPSAPVGVDGLVAGCRVLLEQYEASGDFTMGGKLTNKPFLMIRAALNELFGNSEQLPAVNDEMVERACIAMGHELSPADRWPQDYGREVPDLRRGMRAALTAALATQPEGSDNGSV